MLVAFLKFVHVILAISLLGIIVCCIVNSFQKEIINHCIPRKTTIQFNTVLLYISIFAALTGTLLVKPTHFTFHTPWIQAAYLLLLIFCLIVLIMVLLARKVWFTRIARIIYPFLFIVLILIIHDAVTKSSLI